MQVSYFAIFLNVGKCDSFFLKDICIKIRNKCKQIFIQCLFFNSVVFKFVNLDVFLNVLLYMLWKCTFIEMNNKRPNFVIFFCFKMFEFIASNDFVRMNDFDILLS